MSAEAIRTISLGGELGRRFGRVHRLSVSTPAEAVRALSSQIKGFAQFLIDSRDKGMAFIVLNGGMDIGAEELKFPARGDIRIVPVLAGSKFFGGLFKIIIGAVLVVVGVFTGNVFLVKAGLMLALSGVSQLLAPHPKSSKGDKPNNQANYSFNGAVNTQAQGNPVPVLYGRLKVGSAVISAGISTTDGVYIPTTTASTGDVGTAAGSGGGGGGAGGDLAL